MKIFDHTSGSLARMNSSPGFLEKPVRGSNWNWHHGGSGRPGRHPHPGLETLHPRGGPPGVADTVQAPGRLAIQFYTNPYYPHRGTPHHKLIRLSTKLSPALNAASFSYLIADLVRCNLPMDRYFYLPGIGIFAR
jgi:hypothetical protein